MSGRLIEPSAITRTAVIEDLVARLTNTAFFISEFSSPPSAGHLVGDIAGVVIEGRAKLTRKLADVLAEDEIRADRIAHLHCYHLALQLYKYVFEGQWDRCGRSLAHWQADVSLAALHLEDFVQATSAMAQRMFSAESNGSCEYLASAAQARLKLDKLMAVSLHELALVTHLKEKTIRNLASQPDTGLTTRREGGRAYLDIEQSRNWLESRPGLKTEVIDSFPARINDWLMRVDSYFGDDLVSRDNFYEEYSCKTFADAWRDGKPLNDIDHTLDLLFRASLSLGCLKDMKDQAYLQWALDQLCNYG
jgi:hypothetical protein